MDAVFLVGSASNAWASLKGSVWVTAPEATRFTDLWPKVFQPFSDLSLGWLLRSCLNFGRFQPRLLIAELLIKKQEKTMFFKDSSRRNKEGGFLLAYLCIQIY